jgi:hypothetical protein
MKDLKGRLLLGAAHSAIKSGHIRGDVAICKREAALALKGGCRE